MKIWLSSLDVIQRRRQQLAGQGLAAAVIACVLPVILQGHDLLKNMDPVYKLIWQKCFDLRGGGALSVDVSRYLECTRLLSHAIPLLEGLQLHVPSFLLFTTHCRFSLKFAQMEKNAKIKINKLHELWLSWVRWSALGTTFEDMQREKSDRKFLKNPLKSLSICRRVFHPVVIWLKSSWESAAIRSHLTPIPGTAKDISGIRRKLMLSLIDLMSHKPQYLCWACNPSDVLHLSHPRGIKHVSCVGILYLLAAALISCD